MRTLTQSPRIGALGIAALLLVTGHVVLAQTNGPDTTPVKPVRPEEMNPSEMMQSYRLLQEQLRSAQLAIVNNRLEAEAAAHSQAMAAVENLEKLRQSIALEREKEQAAAERAEYERQRQQAEVQQSTRLAIWVATGFGGAGLLAMLITTALQRRALVQLTEVIGQRPQLLGSSNPWLLPAGTSKILDQTVALSQERLQSTIARMEQRIHELEHMAADPSSPADLAGESEDESGSTEGKTP